MYLACMLTKEERNTTGKFGLSAAGYEGLMMLVERLV